MDSSPKIEVLFSALFLQEFKYFPEQDRRKIKGFIDHIREYGLNHLPGRNKSSDDISPDDPYWAEKIHYVQTHRLWHYHIGIPNYDERNGFGDYTSEYILHYIRGDGWIKIVDFSAHPPFLLPKENYLR